MILRIGVHGDVAFVEMPDHRFFVGANILNIARQDYDPQGASVTMLISEQPVIDRADARGVISEAVVAHIIGANILNVARQDYDPQGASVTILISEEPVIDKKDAGRGLISDAVVAHLDKSHITVHTYPETHPHNGIATFRADIDVATCGVISPLKALNYLIESFDSDIVVMDYRVRGFTRDIKGKKHYIDHKINSIQDYLAKSIKARYEMLDVNVYQENIFHTKMHVKEFDLDTYLFEEKAKNLSFKDRSRVEMQLRREIEELFHGRNLAD